MSLQLWKSMYNTETWNINVVFIIFHHWHSLSIAVATRGALLFSLYVQINNHPRDEVSVMLRGQRWEWLRKYVTHGSAALLGVSRAVMMSLMMSRGCGCAHELCHCVWNVDSIWCVFSFCWGCVMLVASFVDFQFSVNNVDILEAQNGMCCCWCVLALLSDLASSKLSTLT